jgi:hypothetical protein
MDYPRSVFTVDKKGNKEVRVLVDKGQFVRYNYMNPETGKIVEKGKFSIILQTAKGEEHLYIIPLKEGKALVVFPKSEAKERKLWNKVKKKAEDLWQK